MISLIERGQSSATAVVLERLAAGLGVPLSNLFEDRTAQAIPLVRQADQPVWRDPGSGYVRRNVSPPGTVSPMQIVEVSFPAGARVSYETGARDTRVDQQVWMLEGEMEIGVGDATYSLQRGDCLAFTLEQSTMFHNPGTAPARYVVVIVAGN